MKEKTRSNSVTQTRRSLTSFESQNRSARSWRRITAKVIAETPRYRKTICNAATICTSEVVWLCELPAPCSLLYDTITSDNSCFHRTVLGDKLQSFNAIHRSSWVSSRRRCHRKSLRLVVCLHVHLLYLLENLSHREGLGQKAVLRKFVSVVDWQEESWKYSQLPPSKRLRSARVAHSQK